MITSARILIVALIGMVAFTSFAAGASIQGRVTDADEKPVKDAEVRVEGAGGVTLKALKTDSGGHYSAAGLSDGTFNVILLVNGAVKAFIANVATNSGEPSTLNFALQGANKARPFTKGKHYVLAGPQTGTNTQQWIEVPDKPQARGAEDRVNRSGGEQIRRIQDSAGTTSGHQ